MHLWLEPQKQTQEAFREHVALDHRLEPPRHGLFPNFDSGSDEALLSVALHESRVDDRAKHGEMLHLVHLRFDREGELGATATNVAQNQEAGAELRADVLDSVHRPRRHEDRLRVQNVIQLRQLDCDGARRDVPVCDLGEVRAGQVRKKWSRVPRVRGFHVGPVELCPTANPEVRFFDAGEAV